MNFEPLLTAPPAILFHLAAATTALVILPIQILSSKGTVGHVWRGRAWVAAMVLTAAGSFWIRGTDGSLSWIHGLSAYTLVSLFFGLVAIRRGNLSSHRGWMTGAGIGLVIAFAFTFLPSRILGQLLGG
ncbi:DUF2306 domain-containing protein [Hwanghaeella grinnelliae]|uniref:DUF2306 domain-containing protein n=1 Tax=Hwanghaeella grinnelliae TaxID=2500179 RepID=UPI001386A877|nr:DUF2306 domain-containing protein [Hwanghaeella grinnelliae]